MVSSFLVLSNNPTGELVFMYLSPNNMYFSAENA